ncbi:hypothetical protein BDR26DRAFT_866344, partial [Obelidium mucronatum]
PCPSAIVIGAGPVGAATALGLARQGFQVTMVDRVDMFERIKEAAFAGTTVDLTFGETRGGAISVVPNGLIALEALGVKDEVLAEPHNAIKEQMVFFKMDGSDPINHFAAETNFQFLRHNLTMPISAAATAAGVKFITSKKLVDVTQTAESVTATFEDGSKITADILVGADGIHSSTRRIVFPEAEKPKFWTTGYITVFKSPEELKLSTELATYQDGITGNIVFLSKTSKNTGGLFILEGENRDRDGSTDSDWRPYSDLPGESKKLAEVVKGWGATPEVVELVKLSTRITPIAIYDLPLMSTAHKGRVILVGDAGHGINPCIGQGVNTGFEDAAALADLFAAFSPEEYSTVFKLYDQVRQPRLKKVCDNALDVAKRMKDGTPFKAKIGRFIMRTIFFLLPKFGVIDEFGTYDYRKDVEKAVAAYKAKSQK